MRDLFSSVRFRIGALIVSFFVPATAFATRMMERDVCTPRTLDEVLAITLYSLPVLVLASLVCVFLFWRRWLPSSRIGRTLVFGAFTILSVTFGILIFIMRAATARHDGVLTTIIRSPSIVVLGIIVLYYCIHVYYVRPQLTRSWARWIVRCVFPLGVVLVFASAWTILSILNTPRGWEERGLEHMFTHASCRPEIVYTSVNYMIECAARTRLCPNGPGGVRVSPPGW